jgi:S-adenosylmethionine:tRNA ribosyltransferase-isomerase
VIATPQRLLLVDPVAGTIRDGSLDDFASRLEPGDLLVVNDAATLPASLSGRTAAGEPVEVRLRGAPAPDRCDAVLFGAGDWRTRTEDRAPPPRLQPSARIEFAGDLAAVVEQVSAVSPRAVVLRFDRRGDALWSALYRLGRPIQYAHEREEVPLARFQTPYAARPWAAEMPSAGRPLSIDRIRGLEDRGVRIVRLTHAAGLSATGDPALDRALPLPERYEIPGGTAGAVAETRSDGGRIVAVGTSVVRALEGSAARNGGDVAAGSGTTDLVIRRAHRLRIVDGLFSGIHARDSSHFALLEAFLSEDLAAAYADRVVRGGYREHEFGDSTLILGKNTGTRR